MVNLVKSILLIVFVALLQLLIYEISIRPVITTWGASEHEVSMSMVGDNKDLAITSTRGITINASRPEVWKWLMQLGADRGGFYSYSFIEEALGYEMRHPSFIKPELEGLKIGDLVRGSIHEKNSIIPFNFKVVYVKPEESLVLDKWGTFMLKEIDSQHTRLLIRSQGFSRGRTLWPGASHYLEIPLHFIMERRLMIGIKNRAEAGENVVLSQTNDKIWFFGIVLSGCLIGVFVYLARGVMQSLVMSSILSFFWMCSICLAEPVPLYAAGMVLAVLMAISAVMLSGKAGG